MTKRTTIGATSTLEEQRRHAEAELTRATTEWTTVTQGTDPAAHRRRSELAVTIPELKRFSDSPCTAWARRGTSAYTNAGGPMQPIRWISENEPCSTVMPG